MSKTKICGCPEKPNRVNVVYQETVNLQEQSIYEHCETWENNYAFPPKTPNVFAIPGGSNTILKTKTKVSKTTVEELVAQKWQNRYES